MEEKRWLRIGELAVLCGVNARTVDYYTRLGLLEPTTRTEGNFRLYEASAVQRLSLVKALQAQRLSLREIRERLGRQGSEADAAALEEIREQLDGIVRRLEVMQGSTQASSQSRAKDPISSAASGALAAALTLATYLQELAAGGITPP
ncbi:MAG: MerR family transcriptional regulator [Chloroflexota bacterium]|nr:MerR family transcriptional regulator [Chloroflexota bacterium]